MTAFTREQADELANLVRRETSQLATLIRQLQDQSGFLRLLTSGTDRSVNFGSSSVVFTASQTSASTSISHGLGVVPRTVLVCTTGAPQTVVDVDGGPTSTAFGVTGYNVPGVTSGSVFFYWLAIG